MLGNLWPPAVYEREKKAKIPKGRLETVKVNGTLHKGIVLPPSEGEPIGVIKLRQTDFEGLELDVGTSPLLPALLTITHQHP